MKKSFNGKLCDTNTSTLIAALKSSTDEVGIELYRTVRGVFFVFKYIKPHKEALQLLSKPEAMDLYESLPDQKLDYDETFDY